MPRALAPRFLRSLDQNLSAIAPLTGEERPHAPASRILPSLVTSELATSRSSTPIQRPSGGFSVLRPRRLGYLSKEHEIDVGKDITALGGG